MKTFKFKMTQGNRRSRGVSGRQEEKKSRVRRDKNSFLFQTTLKKQEGYMQFVQARKKSTRHKRVEI